MGGQEEPNGLNLGGQKASEKLAASVNMSGQKVGGDAYAMLPGWPMAERIAQVRVLELKTLDVIRQRALWEREESQQRMKLQHNLQMQKELKQLNADLEVRLSTVMQQEQKWQEEAVGCQALREELKQKCILHRKLLESHQKEVLHWSGKESNGLTEMDSLRTRSHSAEDSLKMTEGQLVERLEAKAHLQSTEFAACTNQIEALKKTSYLYEAKFADLKESLLEKAKEISRATEVRQAREANLRDTRKAFLLARKDYELQVQTLKDMISALAFKLHQSLRETKNKGMLELLTSVEAKYINIEEWESQCRGLRKEKERLNAMLAMPMQSRRSASKDLCYHVEGKDTILASLSEELKDMQHLWNLSREDSEVLKYEKAIRLAGIWEVSQRVYARKYLTKVEARMKSKVEAQDMLWEHGRQLEEMDDDEKPVEARPRTKWRIELECQISSRSNSLDGFSRNATDARLSLACHQ